MDIAYAVDLARAVAPLTFDRSANPDGLAPALLEDGDGAFVRLAVQRGVFPDATRGEPARCDRCELREAAALAADVESWHGFSLRLAPGFPDVPHRFVAAQIKAAASGASPLAAVRVEHCRLFVDFRLAGATVALHGLGAAGGWADIMLGLGAGRAELWADGRHVASAQAEALGVPRRLKLGPYRDKHPGWGDGPAAIDFRNIRRGASRADVEATPCP